MTSEHRKHSILGFLASGLLSVFGKSPSAHTTEDLKKADFGTNAQRMGIRFNARIRDVFRFRWIRRKND